MSPKFLRPVVSAGCLLALSSCTLFQKEKPAAADPYAAANPYAGGAQPPAAGYPAANAYGAGAPAAGAYDASGGYAAPNYNTPAPPPAPNYGAGYAGGYSGAGSTPPPAATGSGRVHRVVRGDTLSGISRRYGVGISDLMRANNLQSDVIRIDQKLNIP